MEEQHDHVGVWLVLLEGDAEQDCEAGDGQDIVHTGSSYHQAGDPLRHPVPPVLQGEEAGDHHGGADGGKGEAHHGGPGPGQTQEEVAGQTDGGGLYKAGQHGQSEDHAGQLSQHLRVETQAGPEEDDHQSCGPGGRVPLGVNTLQYSHFINTG